jgi:hypothetical protein
VLSLREASCRGFVLGDDHVSEPSTVKGPEVILVAAILVFEALVAVAGEIQAVRIASRHAVLRIVHKDPARSCRVEVC